MRAQRGISATPPCAKSRRTAEAAACGWQTPNPTREAFEPSDCRGSTRRRSSASADLIALACSGRIIAPPRGGAGIADKPARPTVAPFDASLRLVASRKPAKAVTPEVQNAKQTSPPGTVLMRPMLDDLARNWWLILLRGVCAIIFGTATGEIAR